MFLYILIRSIISMTTDLIQAIATLPRYVKTTGIVKRREFKTGLKSQNHCIIQCVHRTWMPLSDSCHFEKHWYYSYFCQGQITHKSPDTNLSHGQIIQKQRKRELSFLFVTYCLIMIYPPMKFYESITYISGVIAQKLISAMGRKHINGERESWCFWSQHIVSICYIHLWSLMNLSHKFRSYSPDMRK